MSQAQWWSLRLLRVPVCLYVYACVSMYVCVSMHVCECVCMYVIAKVAAALFIVRLLLQDGLWGCPAFLMHAGQMTARAQCAAAAVVAELDLRQAAACLRLTSAARVRGDCCVSTGRRGLVCVPPLPVVVCQQQERKLERRQVFDGVLEFVACWGVEHSLCYAAQACTQTQHP